MTKKVSKKTLADLADLVNLEADNPPEIKEAKKLRDYSKEEWVELAAQWISQASGVTVSPEEVRFYPFTLRAFSPEEGFHWGRGCPLISEELISSEKMPRESGLERKEIWALSYGPGVSTYCPLWAQGPQDVEVSKAEPHTSNDERWIWREESESQGHGISRFNR